MTDSNTPPSGKTLSNDNTDKKINIGIRSKILLYFGAMTLFLIILFYVVILTLVYSGFEQVESYYGQKNVMRVSEAIYADGLSLQGVCEDYSMWDSTYNFVKGEYPEYTNSDFTDDTLIRFEIDYIIITDENSEFVLAKKLDGETVSNLTIEETRIFKNEMRLYVHKYTSDSINGILLLPTGPLLFAATNIIKEYGSNDSAGSMIMIRNVNQKYMDKISAQTKLTANIIPYENFNENLLPDSSLLTGMVTGKLIAAPELNYDIEKYPFKVIDDKHSMSYTVVDDLDSDPSFVIRVISDREISGQAKKMLSLFLISSIIIFLISYLLLFFVINKSILSRISYLNSAMHNMIEKKDYKERITIAGNDELTELAVSFNSTLDGLEFANQERNIVFEANPDTLLMVDSAGKIQTKKVSESIKSSKKSEGNNSNIEISKIFSEDNINNIRLVALESIKEEITKFIEFKEGNGSELKFFEARIRPYKKDALVMIRNITDKKIEENLLRTKNEESERFNKMAIDRELKMVELKKKNEELETKLKKLSENNGGGKK